MQYHFDLRNTDGNYWIYGIQILMEKTIYSISKIDGSDLNQVVERPKSCQFNTSISNPVYIMLGLYQSLQ